MATSILAVSEQPELAPLVARWVVEAFHREPGGMTVEAMTALIQAPARGPEDSFVLFEDDRPVGTASLAPDDLPSRPDLTPWLAGVFVLPEHRGRGHASALVRHVEGFARAASVAELWLYTRTAEPLYARLGWERVGLEQDKGREVTLMRRRLDP
jgi:GNAT superfamily N-acetyltransferase